MQSTKLALNKSAADPRIDALPSGIKAVGEHLGYTAALRLVDLFPGARLHVPHVIPEGHPLRDLGDDVADGLCAHFAGETLEIPVRLVSSEARYRRIVEAVKANPGVPYNQIALEHGTTRRHVFRVVAKARAKGELQ